MNKLLSIFIPTYNRKDSLDLCLKSIIINNPFSIYEEIPIIISSNSDDVVDEETVVQKYKEFYPYIFYYKNEINIGMDKNFDKVYSYTTTKYALLLGDDDFLETDKLQDLYELCKNNDFIWGLTELNLYFKGGIRKKIHNFISDYPCVETKEGYLFNSIVFLNICCLIKDHLA